jgi:cyclin-dependent kinase 10
MHSSESFEIFNTDFWELQVKGIMA